VDARAAYLQEVQKLPIYGCTVFCVREEGGGVEPLTLAVSARGIELFEEGGEEPLALFELKQLLRWGYVPNESFYFAVSKHALTAGCHLCLFCGDAAPPRAPAHDRSASSSSWYTHLMLTLAHLYLDV
jgi:hypothetical protein